MFCEKNILTLSPYEVTKDKKNYIVQNKLTNEYIEMPELAVKALNLLDNGDTIEAVENKLKTDLIKEKTSIVEFAEDLLKLNFIKKIDEKEIEITLTAEKAPERFLWISPLIGKLFFNKVTSKLFLIILFLDVLLLIKFPFLIPSYKDLFVFDLTMLNLLVFAIISLIFALVHEAGHILAIRSENLPANLEIGNRLFFIVLETDLSAGWHLPSKKRNSLYMGGVYFDFIVLFICLLLQLSLLSSGNELILDIVRVIGLSTMMRLLFQCCFYMKTDFYYVFENITGAYNLMENSKYYFYRKLPFLNKQYRNEVYEGEEQIVRWYTLFYLSGTGVTLLLFIKYYIPQLYFATRRMFNYLKFPATTPEFWDGTLFLFQILLFISMFLYFLKRKVTNIYLK